MTQQNELPIESFNQPSTFSPTKSMLLSLRQTKPWVRFLSVLGFLSIVFVVIAGIANMFFLPKTIGTNSFLPSILTGLMNIVFGLLYFFPSLFLFRYASSIGRLVDGGGVKEMEKALANQKSFWKFVGIISLISIGLAILGIVAAIIIPQLVKQ
ncbi:MAG: hypothetical protein GY710_18720 [Desulfobacteraceae bacterium]|nr:hypothetical protein [Desulfobacteraceae bacterium]